jgi:hypothetical protein
LEDNKQNDNEVIEGSMQRRAWTDCFLHSTQQLQKWGACVHVCKIKVTRICAYSITENKKIHSLKCTKISIMKQNMWFVLAEWLSSVNANDEIQKMYM